MPTQVDVPGVGQIEFPDEMSTDQIQSVLKQQFPPQPRTDSLNESVQPWNAGVPKGTIMQHPFESLWKLVNTPSITAEPPKEEVDYAEQSKNPTVKIAMGVREAADDFLSSLTSPLGVGTVGLSTVPKLSALIGSVYALKMGKEAAVDVPQQLGTELGENHPDVKNVARLLSSEALTVPMTAELGQTSIRGLSDPATWLQAKQSQQPNEQKNLTLTPDQVAKLRERNLQANEASQEKPSELVANAKPEVKEGYKQVPVRETAKEKELQGKEFLSTGAYVVRNLKLDPSNPRISREQILNTIKNEVTKGNLTPDEYAVMEPVLKEELSKNPTREELAKKVLESSPKVEVSVAKEGKISPIKQKPVQNPQTKELSPVALQLGFDKVSTVGEVIRNLADRPDLIGEEQASWAKLLNEQFSHVLDFAGVDTQLPKGWDRPAYDSLNHKIYLDASRPDTLISDSLHEATHAALHWLVENPATPEQRFAAKEITKIRNHIIDQLPVRVKSFYNDVFIPAQLRNPNMKFEEIEAMFEKANLNVKTWYNSLYFLESNSEFVAGTFTPNSEFRDMLNNTPYEKQTVWQWVKDTFRNAFGINKGSALDATFDTIFEFGKRSRNVNELPDALQKAKAWHDFETGDIKQAPARKLPSEEGKDNGHDVLWVADSVFTDPGKSKFGDWWNQKLKQDAGWSMPKTMALSRDAGNAGIQYASSRISAPDIARALASRVLGGRAKDIEWQNKVGAALVEDRLRAIWYSLKEQGLDKEAAEVKHVWEREDSPVKSKADVKKVLEDPEVQRFLKGFKDLIQDPATEKHVRLGGKLAASGPESGVFVNLRNLLGDEADKVLFSGARQGDITNPLKRGSRFGQKAKGTGENYEFNVRKLMERMTSANYEEYTKQHWYQELVKAGLAEVVRPGDKQPPELGGKATQKIAIDRRSGKTLNLWIRNDIASEARQAMQIDSPVEKGASQWIVNRLTEAQLIGPVDIVIHLKNMFAAVAGSQGGESALLDIARKLPGVREADTLVRVVKSYRDILRDSPEVQSELANISRIGAGRGTVEHAGVFKTGKIIQAIDKASRLTLSRMYDNLVERKWVNDTQEGRREFINRMGQYNTRLMGRFEQLAKQTSMSPFIVAGKNFNRLALQRLTLDPGLEAANPEAAKKMRVVEAIGLVSTLITLPIALNYLITGKVFGRPGTPVGAIDTGKDDRNGKPIIVDLEQNVLVRRGLNVSGLSAAFKDMSQGKKTKDMIHDAFMDQVKGFASPWEGPPTRFLSTAITGYDTSGYLESEDPQSLGENLMAALKTSLNPFLARMFQSSETGGNKVQGAVEAVTKPLGTSIGVGTGRRPTLFEQEREVPGVDKMNLDQRAKLQKSLAKGEEEMTPKQRLVMEEQETKNAHKVQQDITHSLKPATQDWLNKQKLQVPGFAEYLDKTGVRVYLMPKERDRYMEIMTGVYEDAIRKAKPFVERQVTQDSKQKELNKFVDKAHGLARNKMRNLIGQIP